MTQKEIAKTVREEYEVGVRRYKAKHAKRLREYKAKSPHWPKVGAKKTDVRNVPEIDIEKVPSTILRELIKEVQDEQYNNGYPRNYDRVHNRHNRGRGGGRIDWPIPEPEPEPPTPGP